MDDLAHLIDPAIHFILGAFEALLTQVDRVGEQLTAFLDRLRIASLCQLDSPALQESTQMIEKLVVLNSFHRCSRCYLAQHSRFQRVEQL